MSVSLTEIQILQLYSYFALDAESQIQWIGVAEEWFVEEDDLERYSRNFLIGITVAFADYFEQFDYGDEKIRILADEFRAFLAEKITDCYGAFFSIFAILNSKDWIWVRERASEILTSLKYYPVNFRKPLNIESFIEPYDYVFTPKRECGKPVKR